MSPSLYHTETGGRDVLHKRTDTKMKPDMELEPDGDGGGVLHRRNGTKPKPDESVNAYGGVFYVDNQSQDENSIDNQSDSSKEENDKKSENSEHTDDADNSKNEVTNTSTDEFEQLRSKKESIPKFLTSQSNGISMNKLPYMPSPPTDKKCLGINGYWYDITSFIKKHPGGPVIEEFIGYDATDAYCSFHKHDVLAERHFRPIGYYNEQWQEFNKSMHKLHDELYTEGFYNVNYYWYAMKIFLTLLYISIVFYLVINHGDDWLVLSVTGPLLAFFFQQNGFLMHDAMHTQISHNVKLDEMLGVWTGTVCIGISASWWKDEHMVHHAVTCMIDYAKDFYDPQMKEEVWAQCPRLFPFFQSRLGYFIVKIQHITYIPICMGIGRIAIIIDSFHQEKRWYEWVALITHFSWLSLLLSFIPTWDKLIYFYVLAHVLQGVLHVQLLSNHYSKQFNFRDEIIPDWYRKQVMTNINIINPWWQDFFHGGLNFHIEHHCFPRAPRNRLREISYKIKRVCKQHNVPYDETGFVDIVKRTLVHLKKTGDLFVLKDIR